MEETGIAQASLLRWTLVETDHDTAMFLPAGIIPSDVGAGCRVSLVIGDGVAFLDMKKRLIHVEPPHEDVANRLLSMDSLVLAEQGGMRCWVVEVCRG